MIDQEYYSLRELAELWSAEAKQVTVKQIVHLAMRDEVNIYVRKSVIGKLTVPEGPVGFEIDCWGQEALVGHSSYLEVRSKSGERFYKVSKSYLKEIELMPLDGVTKETTIPLETSSHVEGSAELALFRFNKNKPRRPMTVSVDCFYVFYEELLKLQAKEVSSSGNKYAFLRGLPESLQLAVQVYQDCWEAWPDDMKKPLEEELLKYITENSNEELSSSKVKAIIKVSMPNGVELGGTDSKRFTPWEPLSKRNKK